MLSGFQGYNKPYAAPFSSYIDSVCFETQLPIPCSSVSRYDNLFCVCFIQSYLSSLCPKGRTAFFSYQRVLSDPFLVEGCLYKRNIYKLLLRKQVSCLYLQLIRNDEKGSKAQRTLPSHDIGGQPFDLQLCVGYLFCQLDK